MGFNKRFPYATVGAPGTTHDARLSKESSIYTAILDGDIKPDKAIRLGDFGEIPLVTIGNRAFPQYAWLLKIYNENTRDNSNNFSTKGYEEQGRLLRMRTGRVDSALCTKIIECRLYNLRFICNDRSDPCQSRWRLDVEQLELMEKPLSHVVDKEDLNLIRMKISNWLWMDH